MTPPPYRKARPPLSRLTDSPIDLDAHLPYRVAVLSNLLVATRNPGRRDATDLGLRELRVLLNIGSYAPVRASDIAYQIRMDSFTVSRGVTALEARGLVRGEADPADRRGALLSLTQEGQDVYARITLALAALGEALGSALEPGEAEVLADMLERIESRAEEVLAQDALRRLADGKALTAEEREIVRWRRRRGS